MLLLDKETVGIVSLVYSQKDILDQQVFFHQLLAKKREDMSYLNVRSHSAPPHLTPASRPPPSAISNALPRTAPPQAVVFVRPTENNIHMLCKELRQPKYAEYRVFFSNVVPQDFLARLADADTGDRVREVQVGDE